KVEVGEPLELLGQASIALHYGHEPEKYYGQPLMPPIYLTTTFKQNDPGNAEFDYSRSGNPTRCGLEETLAKIESARYGLTFSSGLAALNVTSFLLKTGDNILVCDDVYGGTNRYLTKCLSRMGITTTFIDGIVIENWTKTFQMGKTKMVWVETPTNPTLKIIDIKGVCQAIKSLDASCLIVVDNTFMSPILQRPLDLGADISMYSCTKSMNGHSDLLMGAIVTNKEDLYNELRFFQNSIGAVPSNFDCYLLQRSLKTLRIRVLAQQETALKVAMHLENHKHVKRVLYPGLKSHEQHDLAQKQSMGPGAMMAICLKGGTEEARKFTRSVKVFTLAESLGCVCSLVEIPALMTHTSVPLEQRIKLGIDDSMFQAQAQKIVRSSHRPIDLALKLYKSLSSVVNNMYINKTTLFLCVLATLAVVMSMNEGPIAVEAGKSKSDIMFLKGKFVLRDKKGVVVIADEKKCHCPHYGCAYTFSGPCNSLLSAQGLVLSPRSTKQLTMPVQPAGTRSQSSTTDSNDINSDDDVTDIEDSGPTSIDDQSLTERDDKSAQDNPLLPEELCEIPTFLYTKNCDKHLIEETRRLLRKKYLKRPDSFIKEDYERMLVDDWTVSRFLLRCRQDPKRASRLMEQCGKFRQQYKMGLSKLSDFPVEFHRSGGLFRYAPDRVGNETLYMRIKMHRRLSELSNIMKQYILCVLEECDRANNGRGTAVVFDLTGCGLQNVDPSFLFWLVYSFRNYCPKGLSYIIVYNLPWILNATAKLALSWLSSTNRKRLRFVSGDAIQDFIAPENLPDFMGGTCKIDYTAVPEGSLPAEETAEQNNLTREQARKIKDIYAKFLHEIDDKIKLDDDITTDKHGTDEHHDEGILSKSILAST
ncbi:Cystathionine gamma-lyase, partial [Fragariocoptes setiger]